MWLWLLPPPTSELKSTEAPTCGHQVFCSFRMVCIEKPIQIHIDKHTVVALSGDAVQDDEGGPEGNEFLG